MENELIEYQKKLDANAEMQQATGNRDKLEQHYRKQIEEAEKIIQQERLARQQLERTLEATSA
eukprot:4092809-Amphidinium_carterae.1